MFELLLGRQSSFSNEGFGPGPQTPIAQTANDFYFGPVAVNDGLPSGGLLATTLNFGSSGLMYDTNLVWLKFKIDSKILFVARNNVIYNRSWSSISEANAIYGSRTIDHLGYRYKIRLLKGDTVDPSNRFSDAWPPASDPTEWGRTLLRVASVAIGGSALWGNYNGTELNFHGSTGGGSWCQETHTLDNTEALIRGAPDGGEILYRPKTSSSFRNWRPVLELVTP